MKRIVRLLLLATALAVPPAFAQKAPDAKGDFQVGDRLAPGAKSGDTQFRQITWDDLIPSDWKPEELFKNLDLESLTDRDPRAMELMQKLREEWDRAPMVERMNGQRIRIPGFVVALDGNPKTIREFLLVPYFGACIHVPPPPANQLIHVVPDKAVPAKWNMAPVWVSGELSIARFESDLGNAGYRLRGVKVEEYKDPLPR